MDDLWLYRAFTGRPGLSYRQKIMLGALAGMLLPLLALTALYLRRNVPSVQIAIQALAVAAVTIVLGLALTLFVLGHLLRPILKTSEALRAYTISRVLPVLPTHFTDEAGTLMADAAHALQRLDAARDELAYFDPVTGLPNRERLLRQLAEWQPGRARFALCVIGLQNHDRIAAAFGHATADAVMRLLGRRLEETLGRGATVARVGPGVFAFVLPGGVEDGASAEARWILSALSAKVETHDIACTPELQAGIALHPTDAREPDALLNLALSALAHAGAGERTAFFSAASRDAARHRLLLEEELRRALDRGEFVLHYQPVINLRAGRVVGAEALIRWQHPERGLVPPGRFIPAAESSGLIDPIGAWVMQAACKQLRAWSESGLRDLRMSINLSPQQFRRSDLMGTITRALSAQHVEASRLEIELTETTMMQDEVHTRAMFGRLRDLGVATVIDDFGTGYSSMSYLKSLPFDKLKIDRAFVSGVDGSRENRAISKALVELSRGLEIEVLAEGTETQEEVETMYRMGCDFFQGFFFAPPLTAEAFTAKLRDPQLADKLSAAAFA